MFHVNSPSPSSPAGSSPPTHALSLLEREREREGSDNVRDYRDGEISERERISVREYREKDIQDVSERGKMSVR